MTNFILIALLVIPALVVVVINELFWDGNFGVFFAMFFVTVNGSVYLLKWRERRKKLQSIEKENV